MTVDAIFARLNGEWPVISEAWLEGVSREIVELQRIAQDSCNDDLLGKTWFQRHPISADKRGAFLIARGRCVKAHPDMPHRSALA